MGQINVKVGDHSYPLACRDGEEAHLMALAAHLDRKAAELSTTLGRMSEPRLLLMAGILIADELFELRQAQAKQAAPQLSEDMTVQLLDKVAERIEALAQALERDGDNA